MDRRQLALFAAALATAALPGAASASTDEKKKGGGITFIQFNTITATVVRGDGRRGVLTLETGIDVPDEKLREYAYLVAPRLRAAFVQVLQTYAARLPPSAPPNADFVAGELQKETDRVLGRKGARLLLGTMLLN